MPRDEDLDENPEVAATAPKGGDIGSRFSTHSLRGDEATGEAATPESIATTMSSITTAR